MDRPACRAVARGALSRALDRALVAAAVVAVLVALAVAGLVRSASTDGPASDAERAQGVAASLRCPTCQGLSVADSGSPLAASMRDIIDEQVAAGASDEEITQYFVDRYSDWVLLAPRAEGLGWVVWAVPGVAVLAGLLVASTVVKRRDEQRSRRSTSWRGASVVGILAVSLGVLVAANVDIRGEGRLPTGNVAAADTRVPAPEPEPEQPVLDVEALQAAVDEDPDDVRTRLALASAAVQTDRLDLAREQADAALEREPRNVDALMLRGLAGGGSDPAATAALRSFLRLAPASHPGVPLVRELLGEER